MANSIVNTAPLILDVGVVLAAAATMGFTARKLGLPSVFGYLLTGLIVSPFTPGFVADSNQLTLLADSLGMNFKNVQTGRFVWKWNLNLAIHSTRSEKSWVKLIGSVGSHYTFYLAKIIETVKLVHHL